MSHTSQRALLVIDLQNDYFATGKFPLWNTEEVLKNTLVAIEKAQQAGDLVVLIQHVADASRGIAPFFNEGTTGVEIHPQVLAAAPDAPVVVKSHADSFIDTSLAAVLASHNIEKLLVCGMMTQNCVAHTALSPDASGYDLQVLAEATSTVDVMIHNIALNAISTRRPLVTLDAAFA